MAPQAPDTLIEIRGLTLAYESLVVLRDINARVKSREVFIIMGGSGWGKNTLLRSLIGLKPPASGDVYYNGQAFSGLFPSTNARHDCARSGSFSRAERSGIP